MAAVPRARAAVTSVLRLGEPRNVREVCGELRGPAAAARVLRGGVPSNLDHEIKYDEKFVAYYHKKLR